MFQKSRRRVHAALLVLLAMAFLRRLHPGAVDKERRVKPDKRKAGNRRLVLTLGGAVAGMFAFAFLLTPLYEVFCELTGLDSERLTRATQPAGAAVASENRRESER